MPDVVVYTYAKCSTCRNATKWLRENGIAFEERPIRETPPTPAELQKMLDVYQGDIRRLFNTSSADYREAGLKDRLDTWTPEEAFAVQQQNGNLVKRPFLLTADGRGIVGFKEDQWAAFFGK
ncbi:MAG: arsenate reductase family protein [Verrucomicrobiota bacterium JB022]|nr:arsenate reductase family protein [Verrucomicrobiota bacterium JB022]